MLALVAAMALAGAAYAAGTGATAGSGPQGAAAEEGGTSPEGTPPGSSGEGAPGAAEEGEGASTETPAPSPAEEEAGKPVVPAIEETVPAPLPVPTPVPVLEETPPPTQVVEETVPAPLPAPVPVLEETPPPTQVVEEAIPPAPVLVEEVPTVITPPPPEAEPAVPVPPAEEGPAAAGREPAGLSSHEVPRPAVQSVQPQSVPSASEGALAPASVPPAPPPPRVGDPGETWASAASGATALPPPSVATRTAQQAHALDCALSALGGADASACGGAWLISSPLLSPARTGVAGTTVRLIAPASPWDNRRPTGLPPTGGGDSSGDSHAVSPTPGPSPAGASGGSAAGGAGGMGLSAFLTLASLLMMSASRALRRLRLRSRPWRTAFFVLIPERPG